MRTRTAALAAAVVTAAAALLLTGCGSDATSDTAACKAAVTELFDDIKHNSTDFSRPGACAGVDEATLQRIITEVGQEQMKSAGLAP
ncbi:MULTISPECIES: hypothetical protein [unclassified Streptomyces]|uniref:hypothetical protein n=1 Tax=unclassified Streptomyces TaxID=2593676 RepID=UPI00382487AC